MLSELITKNRRRVYHGGSVPLEILFLTNLPTAHKIDAKNKPGEFFPPISNSRSLPLLGKSTEKKQVKGVDGNLDTQSIILFKRRASKI